MLTSQRIKEGIEVMSTNLGRTIAELSDSQPVMIIFLRHFGCTFCREALAEISLKRENIAASGTKLIFVHMADQETAEQYFTRYNLEGVEDVSDPDCNFYALFGLVKGKVTQLMGLRVWMRGFQAGVVEGHGLGKLMGDSFQMPGIFLLQNRIIRDQYIHKLSSDKPDYEKLTECCRVA